MKSFRQILLLLLVLALAIPLLCACGEEKKPSSRFDDDDEYEDEYDDDDDDGGHIADNWFGNGESDSNSYPQEPNVSSPSAEESHVSQDGGEESGDIEENDPDESLLEIRDLGGRIISVLSMDFGIGGEVISDTEYAPTRIDRAKKEVVEWVEEQYNVSIEECVLDFFTKDTIQEQVITATYGYDLIFAPVSYCASLSVDSLLADLNNVDTLNLDYPWWDQNSVSDFAFGDRLFFVCGSINIYDDLATSCVLFNKALKDNLNIQDDFYQVVKDGDWTLDYFMEICRGVTQDHDGNGSIDEFDLWACGTETFNVYAHMMGGAISTVTPDASGFPTLSLWNESSLSAMDKIINFYNSPDVMVANGGKFDNKGYANVWEATTIKAFTESRELFFISNLVTVSTLRFMEDDFGLLPMPKTFTEQEGYSHSVSSYASCLMIPNGLPEIEEAGLIAEALAFKSHELVAPALGEMLCLRDAESEEMLDLILNSRMFDLATVFNWGNVMSWYTSIDPNIASRLDAIYDIIEADLADTVADISNHREFG